MTGGHAKRVRKGLDRLAIVEESPRDEPQRA